jgi:hypothetical protein
MQYVPPQDASQQEEAKWEAEENRYAASWQQNGQVSERTSERFPVSPVRHTLCIYDVP